MVTIEIKDDKNNPTNDQNNTPSFSEDWRKKVVDLLKQAEEVCKKEATDGSGQIVEFIDMAIKSTELENDIEGMSKVQKKDIIDN